MRRSRKYQPDHMLEVGERDGWKCHYCFVPLVPLYGEEGLCEWVPREEFWDHCGCGKHVAGGGAEPMPCVSHAYWRAPDGYQWPTLDHVEPVFYGGGDTPDNLVLACRSCNARKGTTDYFTFLSRLEAEKCR